jgi:hypothetical protein
MLKIVSRNCLKYFFPPQFQSKSQSSWQIKTKLH